MYTLVDDADHISELRPSGVLLNIESNGQIPLRWPGRSLIPKIAAFDFAGNGSYIGASHLGSRPEMIAMLDLAAMHYPKIKSWIHTVPIGPKGCAEAVHNLYKDDVRYRYVLTDYDEAFGKRT